MEELIKTFHIDWTLMLAQLINFAIVFFVIYRFALKPLTKVMAERGKVIAQSLDQAKVIERTMKETAEETKRQLAASKKEAAEILAEARQQAELKRSAIVKETEAKTQQIVAEAKQQIQVEKDKLIADAREEMIELVVTASAKLLQQKIDTHKDRTFISEQVTSLKSHENRR